MEMTITHQSGGVDILHLKGTLDGSNYRELIQEAQTLYAGGLRKLILDLGQLTFMSSAGISALHRMALIFRGDQGKAAEEGWASYRAMGNGRENGVQQFVKLLNPNERVIHSLELIGFTSFFEIYTDQAQAVASFQ